MSVRAEMSRESAPRITAPQLSGAGSLCRGCFEVSFAAERPARAAARDATAAGFVVAIREGEFGRWLIVSRRKDAFPADDGDRYASRLRAIAGLHGGTYDRFVPE